MMPGGIDDPPDPPTVGIAHRRHEARPAATARAQSAAGSSTTSSILTEQPPSVSGLKFWCSEDSSATQKSAPPTDSWQTPPPGTEYSSSAPNPTL